MVGLACFALAVQRVNHSAVHLPVPWALHAVSLGSLAIAHHRCNIVEHWVGGIQRELAWCCSTEVIALFGDTSSLLCFLVEFAHNIRCRNSQRLHKHT